MTDLERGQGMIADRLDLQRVEHAVARILGEEEHPMEAYAAVLQVIGSSLGWELGSVWELDADDGRLRCVRTWRSGTGGAEEFEALSERLVLSPGEGLPGRVVSTGEPAWITGVPDDANFPRADAARRSGLHAAFGFPLRSPRGVVGVMEFFSREHREPDEGLLRTMATLGSQVGQFVVRRHAEEEVHASESRLRAMLEAALDAVVTMDAGGRVVGWNQAAAAVFGYHASEAIGRDMAELIVPPRLRQLHRQGLARFLEGGRPVILDRRLELTGMRRDGTEFPVELTITKIALPGPPMFTGYLRDITHRVRAEQALQASRARLVEVADAERQRIQRNLHDGAQQRITAVLLMLGRLREAPEERRAELLDLAVDELATSLEEIRELAGGLHPSVLTERGLAAALHALALAAPVTVELQGLPDERLPEPVEAAVYYVVAEAVANAQKHSFASAISVRLQTPEGSVIVEIVDDGIGGADLEGGGLRGLTDRVEALGGRLSVESPAGKGTHLSAEIPLGSH
jgi:PAS domain S-box-containing protein